jgi:hypothetical protein
MAAVLLTLLAGFATLFRSRLALHREILALRHQSSIYQRIDKRPRIRPGDCLFWSWLSCRGTGGAGLRSAGDRDRVLSINSNEVRSGRM